MFHAMSGTSNYRLGSLDFYDGVILVGPHQEADLKKIEEIRNIKKKDYVALGLPYLDDMLHHMPSEGPAQKKKDKTTVLIAPSWGNKGCFSEYGVGFVKELAKAEYEIIIRLHPQSHISEAEKVALWKEELSGFHNVAWDQELFAHQAMASSDVLISDTSSIRFDYAFLYLKPVITLDIPKENRDEFESKYFDITWSETSSALIGEVLDKDTIDILSSKVKEILQQNQQEQIEKFRQETVVNFGDSASHIVEYIRTQANEINTKKGSPDA
ncbi:CDP-glycerol glycerophosphotransferase family protein [Candidatus Terasakiella magnetica]|nr:CDP-glycerol glycerophosphotransferase family protein [Candidatus Terasakiella magnetica]